MKEKFVYDLSFKVGGHWMDYREVAAILGINVPALKRENVYNVRLSISRALENMGFADVDSELCCSC